MKRRTRKIINFFAFNLLFFALYLNFIHRDKGQNFFNNPQIQQQVQTENLSGNEVVNNELEVKKEKTQNPETERTEALKLSIN
ncbi:MAG: hypothetical protein N2747_04325 [Chitinophagaceae bacterium]|nr:hypothetical protein [Chitinophagaceae bacterium]